MTVRVFRNAHIYSGADDAAAFGAIAVKDGVIVAVGDEASVRAKIDEPTELIDLDGAAVIPGLNDAHIHTANYARDSFSVDLRGSRSLEAALSAITAHIPKLAPGGWVFGGRWNSNTWDKPVQPNRYDLDSVTPGRPAALPSVDGHTVWANSRALELIGIDRSTPDPEGGQIARDADGEATGILRESASYPLRSIMNSPESGDLEAQLLSAQEDLLSVGLTSVQDIDGEDCRAAYLRLYDAGKLKMRVYKAIPVGYLDGAIEEGRKTGDGDDWFKTGPVKLFSDGALGSHTCHMNEGFVGDEANTGIAVTSYDDLARMMRKANAAGIVVATHAIGDRANQLVLDAYEAVLASGTPQMRNRIEHAQHLLRSDVTRMARLGVIASMQPTHCTSDIDIASALLAGRDLASYAWRSMLNSGVALAFGSDAPVEEINPFLGLYSAVTRTHPDGEPEGGWQPEQRLSIGEAITAHTLGSAYASGEESRKGRLEPGMLADFIAVDTDPFTESADAVRRTQVLTTVVGGNIAWQRKTS